jgi:hypothetical protein
MVSGLHKTDSSFTLPGRVVGAMSMLSRSGLTFGEGAGHLVEAGLGDRRQLHEGIVVPTDLGQEFGEVEIGAFEGNPLLQHPAGGNAVVVGLVAPEHGRVDDHRDAAPTVESRFAVAFHRFAQGMQERPIEGNVGEAFGSGHLVAAGDAEGFEMVGGAAADVDFAIMDNEVDRRDEAFAFHYFGDGDVHGCADHGWSVPT